MVEKAADRPAKSFALLFYDQAAMRLVGISLHFLKNLAKTVPISPTSNPICRYRRFCRAQRTSMHGPATVRPMLPFVQVAAYGALATNPPFAASHPNVRSGLGLTITDLS